MTLAQLKEEYGMGKYLTKAARSDFTPNNRLNEYLFHGVQVCIELEFYPNKWIYNSYDIPLSGRFIGKLSSLVKMLKYEIDNF